MGHIVHLHLLYFWLITGPGLCYGVRNDFETKKKAKHLKKQRNLREVHLLRNSETSSSLTESSQSRDFGNLSSWSKQERDVENTRDSQDDDHNLIHHLLQPIADLSYAMAIATAENTYTLLMSYDFSPTNTLDFHTNNSISPTTSKSSFFDNFSPSTVPTVTPTHLQSDLHPNIPSASILPSLSPSSYGDSIEKVTNESPLSYVPSLSPTPSGISSQLLSNIPSISRNTTVSPSMTMKPSYLPQSSFSYGPPHPSLPDFPFNYSDLVSVSSIPSVLPGISMKPTSGLVPANSAQPLSLTSSPSSLISDIPSSLQSNLPSILFSPSLSPGGSMNPSLENDLSPSIISTISPAPTVIDSDTTIMPSLLFTPSLSIAPTSSRTSSNKAQPSGFLVVNFTPSRPPLVSLIPSGYPTSFESISRTPSQNPTRLMLPSALPTKIGTFMPSSTPTSKESSEPSMLPTIISSEEPPYLESLIPSIAPSDLPMMTITDTPTTSLHFTSIPSVTHFPSYTNSPTKLCNLSNEKRETAITNQLMQVTDPLQLLHANTPQNNALNWIIHEDFEYYACPYDKDLIQRYIMAVFYFSTGGDEWSECSSNIMNNICPEGKNFLSDVSECEWGGSSCNSEGAIFNVTFEKNNLDGFIPSELGYLPELQILSLEQGTLRGTIPSSLGNLSKLRILDLDFNYLSGSIPSTIYNITTLLQLDLNNNFLTGTIPKAVENLENLVFVQLQNNQLSGTIPTEIGFLENIRLFEIFGNNISGQMPQEICAIRVPNGNLAALSADCFGNPKKVTCSCCTACAAK